MLYATRNILILCFSAFLSSVITLQITGPHTVSEYATIKLGGISPLKPGDLTVLPIGTIPESNFYVQVIQRDLPFMCVFDDCGMTGVLVDCMGGWLSGEKGIGDTYVPVEGLEEGKASLVFVADKNLRIVGIYPNYTVNHIPRILKKHRELSNPPGTLERCLEEHMPR